MNAYISRHFQNAPGTEKRRETLEASRIRTKYLTYSTTMRKISLFSFNYYLVENANTTIINKQ